MPRFLQLHCGPLKLLEKPEGTILKLYHDLSLISGITWISTIRIGIIIINMFMVVVMMMMMIILSVSVLALVLVLVFVFVFVIL